MNTATNPRSAWLFPGGRAGQPLNPSTVRHQFQALAIPTTQARTAAFRQLTLQAPAPVVADALGYTTGAAHRHHAAAGGTWHRYPASVVELEPHRYRPTSEQASDTGTLATGNRFSLTGHADKLRQWGMNSGDSSSGPR